MAEAVTHALSRGKSGNPTHNYMEAMERCPMDHPPPPPHLPQAIMFSSPIL